MFAEMAALAPTESLIVAERRGFFGFVVRWVVHLQRVVPEDVAVVGPEWRPVFVVPAV